LYSFTIGTVLQLIQLSFLQIVLGGLEFLLSLCGNQSDNKICVTYLKRFKNLAECEVVWICGVKI